MLIGVSQFLGNLNQRFLLTDLRDDGDSDFRKAVITKDALDVPEMYHCLLADTRTITTLVLDYAEAMINDDHDDTRQSFILKYRKISASSSVSKTRLTHFARVRQAFH